MAAVTIGSSGWTRLHAVGRGASGTVVSLAADDASGELFVVKSAGGAAVQLRHEWSVMSGLSSPHVLKCLWFSAAIGGGAACGEHQLFLEFAPGGSLADVAARNGGRLEEGAVRAYAVDVLRGLEYIHGRLVVHGDVKGTNVVVGADGRAKLADFGCARVVGDSKQVFGGTPAFMAPEVARGEEQGPAADVWALGCTVIEMTTGRAPWSDVDNVLAAVRRIGYTDAMPEVPPWLSPEARDFLDRCLQRCARDRSTAAQLLEHPFMAMSSIFNKEEVKATRVSPTSALDVALWESETDDEADDMWNSPVGRIRAMACSHLALPDWDSDEGWIEVISGISIKVADIAAAAAAAELTECPAKRVRAWASPPSNVPDWDSDEGWIEVLSGISSKVADIAAADDEASECPAKRVKALVCPISSVPDWDSNQGWIEVRCKSSAGEKGDVIRPEEFEVAAADELFNDALQAVAVHSVGVGVCRDEALVEHQEDVFSLSSFSEQIVLAVHVADAATGKAGIKQFSISSYYIALLFCGFRLDDFVLHMNLTRTRIVSKIWGLEA